MTADVAKHAAAMAALRFVAPDAVLGVGSGTTPLNSGPSVLAAPSQHPAGPNCASVYCGSR
jgi:hypothetical protein